MIFTTLASILLSASSLVGVSAAPMLSTRTTTQTTGCNLSNYRMPVPSGQTTITSPSVAPEYVAVGVGIQNYTCQSGVWTSVGAVASLYDISCFVNDSFFDEIPQYAYEMASKLEQAEALEKKLNLPSPIAAILSPILYHFFVENPVAGSTGVDPRFNQAGSSAYSILSKTAALASPAGATNVAWLHLTQVEGNLASSTYRMQTYLGSAPTAACTAPSSQVLTVKYAAQYFFFK